MNVCAFFNVLDRAIQIVQDAADLLLHLIGKCSLFLLLYISLAKYHVCKMKIIPLHSRSLLLVERSTDAEVPLR
jgi:hypothetical protein